MKRDGLTLREVTRREFLCNSLQTSAGIALSSFLGFADVVKSKAFAQAIASPKNILVYLTGAKIESHNWDPTSHTSISQMFLQSHSFGFLCKTPMRIDNPERIVYELATSQRLIDDYTLEYTLRDGVQFHDGKLFSAEDVKASLEYESRKGSRVAGAYPGPFDVKIIDRLTCRILTKKGGYPASQFWFRMSGRPIMSANDIKNPQVLSERINGTGPFKFIKSDKDEAVLVANKHYFRGVPKIEELRIHYVPDVDSRIHALESGEADMIDDLESDHIGHIQSRRHLKVDSIVSTENMYLIFRCNKAPFDDWRIRRAACHAIDRKRIWYILGEGAYPSYSHIAPTKFGYAKIKDYPEYNPAISRYFLSKASHSGGKELPELEFLSIRDRYPKTIECGNALVEMLNEVGFKVKATVLQPEDRKLIYNLNRGHLVYSGWRSESPEPDFIFRFLFDSKYKFMTGINDPEIDRSLDCERNEGNIQKRKHVIQNDTLPLLARKAPAHSLFTSNLIYAANKNISNYTIYPWGVIDFSAAQKI